MLICYFILIFQFWNWQYWKETFLHSPICFTRQVVPLVSTKTKDSVTEIVSFLAITRNSKSTVSEKLKWWKESLYLQTQKTEKPISALINWKRISTGIPEITIQMYVSTKGWGPRVRVSWKGVFDHCRRRQSISIF